MDQTQILEEYEFLNQKLKEYYNQCYADSLIKTNDYEQSFFAIYENKLYISISYLLSTFRYQTKLFYNYLIKDKLNIFNIIVIKLENTNSFGLLQYKITNNYFNKKLLFETLNETDLSKNNIYDNTNYNAFYAAYILENPQEYDISNNMANMAISEFIFSIFKYAMKNITCDFINSIDEEYIVMDCEDNLLNITDQNKLFFDQSSLLSYNHPCDNENYFCLLKKVHISKPNNDTSIYLSSIPFNDLHNSFEVKNSYINISMNLIELNKDILNKYSWSLINDHTKEIKELISKQKGSFNYFQRLQTFVERSLLMASAFIDNAPIVSSYLKEACETIKDNYKNANMKVSMQNDLVEICSNMFISKKSYQTYNFLMHICKKILIELPDFIEEFDFKYSPALIQFII